MMESPEQIVRRFFDRVWNVGDFANEDLLFDAAFRHHDLVTHAETDLAGFLRSIRSIRGVFSQLKLLVQETVTEDGRIASRWTAVGEHRLSGREVTVHGMSIDHVLDGRIVENWTVWDRHGLKEQLPEEFR